MFYIIPQQEFENCNLESDIGEIIQTRTGYASLDDAEMVLVKVDAVRVPSLALSKIESSWEYEGNIYLVIDSTRKFL